MSRARCSWPVRLSKRGATADDRNATVAVFGDIEDAALTFVEPDARGRQLLPEAVVPCDMRDGSAWGAHVRVHPDPRIRALQRQSREGATRQRVVRLRLAHAGYPERVTPGRNIPIPGLPVDMLQARG